MLKKAAAQGNANLQYSLGIAYYKGEGVAQDFEKAVEWFGEAAAQGDAKALCALGCAYATKRR